MSENDARDRKRKNMNKKYRLKIDYLIILLLFIASLLLRFAISDFPKRAETYRDELRYLQIAKNIYHFKTIDIYGISNDYQKVLYPFLLSSFFAISNGARRLRMISLFNCFLMSSAVFPAYLIGKKVGGHRRAALFTAVMTVLLPDMCFSMTFMSENLYLPLGLWVVYLILIAVDERDSKKKYMLNICAGLGTYLLYLTKEVALCFLISYILLMMWTKIAYKERVVSLLLGLFSYVGSFLILFILGKIFLFSSMGNSYRQTDLLAILSMSRIKYMLFAFVYNGLFLLIGLFYFPVVLPLYTIKEAKPTEKKFYLFLLCNLLVMMVTIVYTISVREDFGSYEPRQHHRYYAPYIVCLLPLLCAGQERHQSEISKTKRLLFWMLPVLVSLGIMMLLDGFRTVGVDNTTLAYYNMFLKAGERLASEGKLLFFTTRSKLIIKGCICLCIMVGTWTVMRYAPKCHVRMRKSIKMAAVGIMVVVMMFNNVLKCREFRAAYSITPQEREELCSIDSFLQNCDGTLLVIHGTAFDLFGKKIDSYLNRDYIVTTRDAFMELFDDEGRWDMNTGKIMTIYKNENIPYDSYARVDYVLVEDSLPFLTSSAVEMDIPLDEGIHLYRVLSGNSILVDNIDKIR